MCIYRQESSSESVIVTLIFLSFWLYTLFFFNHLFGFSTVFSNIPEFRKSSDSGSRMGIGESSKQQIVLEAWHEWAWWREKTNLQWVPSSSSIGKKNKQEQGIMRERRRKAERKNTFKSITVQNPYTIKIKKKNLFWSILVVNEEKQYGHDWLFPSVLPVRWRQ